MRFRGILSPWSQVDVVVFAPIHYQFEAIHNRLDRADAIIRAIEEPLGVT